MNSDIEFIRKEYKKQKKLETIVNTRILNKPSTKKWQVATNVAILLFLLSGVVPIAIAAEKPEYKILIVVLSILLIAETHLRFCFFIAVKCYQHYATEEVRRTCKCIPSCSEYALLSLKRVFPLFVALLKIRKRLYVVCNGEEYKIDFPIKKMNEDYEKSIENG